MNREDDGGLLFCAGHVYLDKRLHGQQKLPLHDNVISSRSDIARSARPCITLRKRPKRRAAWGKTITNHSARKGATENSQQVIKLYMTSIAKTKNSNVTTT